MLNLKKTVATLGIALMAVQGLPGLNLNNDKAEAASYPSAIKELMSRQYPRIGGNQWHIQPDGSYGSGNTASVNAFAGKYLDFVSLNRAGGNMNDLFLDFYQSTHDPSKGALKTKNDIYSAASANGRKVYVLVYHNMSDVWNYESVKNFPNENFWMKPDGKNIGTWDYMDQHNYWARTSSGSIVTYPGYSSSQRRMFDSRKTAVQDYWAKHAKGITDQGFDGLFSDNWLRSGFAGDQAGLQKGWNATGAKFKELAPNKILLGNSPPFSTFTSRDICMLEDRIDDVLGTGDRSIGGYLKYSDQAASMNQACFDTFWDEDKGPFETFRVPMVLLTDNILGLTLHTKQGHGLSIEQPTIEKLGKIGYPKGPRYRANGVLQRDFDKAKVIVNDTSSSVTIKLPSGVYKNLDGTQVNSVTVASKRGVVLKTSGTVTTPPTDNTPQSPTAPSGLTANITKASSGNYIATLSWKDNSNNETGFKVMQSVNSTTSYQQVQTPNSNVTSTTIDLGANPAQGTYNYQVFAVNSGGTSSASNTANAQIGNNAGVPTAPSGVTVKSVTKGASTGTYYVNLAWQDNSGNEAGFEIYQSVNSTDNFKLVKTPGANVVSYGINIGTNPTSGTYYYKVLAKNSAGKSTDSNIANAQVGQAAPPTIAAPSDLTVAGVSKGASTGTYYVKLTWKDNSSNEKEFKLYQSINSTSNFQVIKTPIANSNNYNVNIGTSPTKGTYYYKITAVDANGKESQASNTATATVN